MCNNFKEIKEKEFIGYKVVAKYNNQYYSIFTGEKYPENGGKMPIWFDQSAPLTGYFNSDVLMGEDRHLENIKWLKNEKTNSSCPYRTPPPGWRKEIVGRTSVFKSLKSAQDLLTICVYRKCYASMKFKFLVVKAKVEVSLMKAEYRETEVMCGKRITFLEEV